MIDEGKQAVYFNFNADYSVMEMEFAGALLDKTGVAIHIFDTSMLFGKTSKTPTPVIMINAALAQNIQSVSFTKIKAYTAEYIII